MRGRRYRTTGLHTPLFEPYILPVTIVILVGLFAIQCHETAKVAAWFGPITAGWLLVIGAAGAVQLFANPGVLAAFNPAYTLSFLTSNWGVGLVTLGAVFLAVTDAEGLYADLGHFGRRPIQLAWVGLVLPALALNYLGQGALLLRDPTAIENPFYRLFPEPLLAGSPVHHPYQQCHRRHGVLLDPQKPRGRDRHPTWRVGYCRSRA